MPHMCCKNCHYAQQARGAGAPVKLLNFNTAYFRLVRFPSDAGKGACQRAHSPQHHALSKRRFPRCQPRYPILTFAQLFLHRHAVYLRQKQSAWLALVP